MDVIGNTGRICCASECDRLKKFGGGAVAQLGARLDGIEEVVGSNPIGSTKFQNSIPKIRIHSLSHSGSPANASMQLN
jgi:hypothetical protein